MSLKHYFLLGILMLELINIVYLLQVTKLSLHK